MRQNLPVSDVEYAVPQGVAIVSKTDLRGVITYANDAFVEVSGYARDQLIGQPHNLVRHPDMPEQAFAHLWKTLQKGNPWKGIVKNRRRDGSYYWVKAVVVPIRKNDETVGFMSVREAATRTEITAAELLYTRMRQRAEGVRDHPLQRLLTIRTGFALGVLFVVSLMIAGGVLGIGGLRNSNQVVTQLYQAHVLPVSQANQLDAAIHELRNLLAAYYMQNEHGGEAVGLTAEQRQGFSTRLAAAEQVAEQHWRQLKQSAAADSGHLLQIEQAFGALRGQVVLPLQAAIARGDAVPSLNSQVPRYLPYFKAVHAVLGDFQQVLNAQAEQACQEMRVRNDWIERIALAGIVLGMLAVIVVGRFFLRDIIRPLETAIDSFDRIAQGDLTGEVEVFGKGETGQLLRASAVMQMHLKVITDQISNHGRSIHEHCLRLNGALFEISDHSEVQHDRLSEARGFLAMNFADDLKAGLANVQQQMVILRLAAGDLPEFDPLQEELDKIINLWHLQSFALDDFMTKIDLILELVVENRQDTQEAYAMSEQLQAAAHQMNQLVSYFTASKEPVAVVE